MTQTFTDDCFAGGHAGQTDLQNMENNFASLKSSFSGATQPSNVVAGMLWLDTANFLLKYRDSANSAWLGVMHGDVNQKIWVYRNSALSGWVVDSSVSDKVLALKGGSTYTTGAATAGNWVGVSHTHSMKFGFYYVNPTIAIGYAAGFFSGTFNPNATVNIGNDAGAGSGYDKAITEATTSPDGTWRPAAAVGTLQYLDI